MNRRVGSIAFFSLMGVMTVAAMITNAFIFDLYVDSLATNTQSKSIMAQQRLGVREEVMNAECATIERGIFRLEDVIEGNFECITLPHPVRIRFKWDGNQETYRVYGSPPQVEISNLAIPILEDTEVTAFPVVIYDNGEYHAAQLSYVYNPACEEIESKARCIAQKRRALVFHGTQQCTWKEDEGCMLTVESFG